MSFLRPVLPLRHVPAASLALLLTGLASCGARTDVAVATVMVTEGGAAPTEAGSSCPGAPAGPEVLATFGTGIPDAYPFAFSIGQDAFFVELTMGANPKAIERVPLAGGVPRSVIVGEYGCPSKTPFGGETPIVTDGETLYMIGVDITLACDGSSRIVRTFDIATGALGAVPLPAGTTQFNVFALRATAERGVYYLTGSEFDPSASDLVHWDGTTSTIVSTLPEWCYDFQIVGRRVFAIGAKAIYELSIDGGTATPIQPVTFGMKAGLLASNSSSIFYTLDGTTILRRDVATGATFFVASPAQPSLSSGSTWADDRYFYFGAGIPIEQGLLRVPADGGNVETFWSAERGIDAVMTIGCKVYWLADTDYPHGRPPELLVAPE